MTCFPVSTHVSISIYTLELEKKSSVAVTFTLFVNAQLTFSPVKYPYCALCRLLLSIQYPNIEECVGVVYTEKAERVILDSRALHSPHRPRTATHTTSHWHRTGRAPARHQ